MSSLFYDVNLGLFYISFMLDLFISDTYSWTWGWWPWCVECLPGLPCLLRGSRPALCSLPCWSLASCSAPALESALPRAHHPRYHLTYILHRACSVRIHTHALFMGGPIGAAGWWLVENKGRNQFTLGLLSSSFSPSPDDGSCAGVQTLISHLQRSSLAHLHHWTLSTPILFTNAILPSTPFHPNFSPWLQRTSWTISLSRWNIHYKPKMLLSSNSHLK